MKKRIGVLGVGLALFMSGSAIAQQSAPATGLGITRLVIAKHQVAFGGASFGSAGAYEILAGTAYGELDPGAIRAYSGHRVSLEWQSAHLAISTDFAVAGIFAFWSSVPSPFPGSTRGSP